MAEYIFQPENNSSSLTSGIEDMCALIPKDWYGTIQGEIVRCRDCKYFNYFACEKFACTYCGELQRVDSDGFCAWGERMEVKPYVKPRTIDDVLRDLVDGIGSVEFDALTAIGEAADEIRELIEVDAERERTCEFVECGICKFYHADIQLCEYGIPPCSKFERRLHFV